MTVCVAGQYIQVEGTKTTDRTCAPCPPKTFTLSAGQMTCTLATVCGLGLGIQTAATSTSDAVCQACTGTSGPSDKP